MILAKRDKNSLRQIDIKIENETIERVSVFTYLGVKLDNKFTLKEQAIDCTKKAAGKTNLLFRISKNLTFHTKKQ